MEKYGFKYISIIIIAILLSCRAIGASSSYVDMPALYSVTSNLESSDLSKF